jgi:hypothetical protein
MLSSTILEEQFDVTLPLQIILSDHHHSLGNKVEGASIHRSKRATRINLLAQARGEILSLREQIRTLKEKLKNLRELAFPTTCKYTLRNS